MNELRSLPKPKLFDSSLIGEDRPFPEKSLIPKERFDRKALDFDKSHNKEWIVHKNKIDLIPRLKEWRRKIPKSEGQKSKLSLQKNIEATNLKFLSDDLEIKSTKAINQGIASSWRLKKKKGRPKVFKKWGNQIIKASVPLHFKMTLGSIIESKNKLVKMMGAKEWGYGRAIRFIYEEYERLDNAETQRIEKLATEIWNLYTRYLQFKDDEIVKKHGFSPLYYAYIREIKIFEEKKAFCGITREVMKIKMSNEVISLYEVIIQSQVILRDRLKKSGELS